MYLTDLPGCKGDIAAPIVSSVSAAMKAIRRHRACTLAGDHGAINVWVDDDGKLLSGFYRYLMEIDQREHPSKKALREWLVEWVPKLNERPQ